MWVRLAGSAIDVSRASAGTPQLHFVPRAKSVIFCFMDGGPSHVDTFDPKPMLKKHQGKPIGDGGFQAVAGHANRVWLGSPWEFKQRGKSGLWVSDLFPHLAEVADELCVVRRWSANCRCTASRTCCCTPAA